MKKSKGMKQCHETITLTEDDFVNTYRPILNHLDQGASFDWGGGCGSLFESCGQELSFVMSQVPETIWTLLTIDSSLTIVSGYHFVNRLGYFISRTAVESGISVEVPLDTEDSTRVDESPRS